MKLRKYQEEAVEAVLKAWQTFRRVLVVLPTGCGKTIVFASVIRRLMDAPEHARRVMVLAHREELIFQAKEKIEAVAGADVQIEMGEMKVGEYFGKPSDVVVSTVQTQLNRRRKFRPEEFAAVVVDEAHHAVARSYRETVAHYLANPSCRLLGVTATPDRGDELALRSAFDAVAYEYTVAAAIADGWLVPVRQQLVKVESLDFSGVSTSAGDLNSAELAEVMEDEKNLHGVVAPVLEICRGKKTILFATSVKQAERLCEIINRSDAMKADWVSGATPKETRRARLEAFRRREVDVMCNVGVLTEGFDDAGVEVVVMARPTKSRALYAQMAGRATRPAAEIAAALGEEGDAARRRGMIAASAKPACLIVDFVGNSGRHKLVTTVDILAGRELDADAEEVRRVARRKIEENGATVTITEVACEDGYMPDYDVGYTFTVLKGGKTLTVTGKEAVADVYIESGDNVYGGTFSVDGEEYGFGETAERIDIGETVTITYVEVDPGYVPNYKVGDTIKVPKEGLYITVTAEQQPGFSLVVQAGSGVTGGQFTVGDTTYDFSTTPVLVESDQTVSIATVNYQLGYEPDGTYKKGYSATVSADATWTVTGTAVEPGEDPVLPQDVTPAEAGITNPTLQDAQPAEVKELVKWQATYQTDGANINQATFDAQRRPTNDQATGYLLDCAPTAEGIAAAREDFSAEISFDASGNPIVNIQGESPEATTYGNGTLIKLGATTLSGPWTTDLTGAHFFKFELVR